MTSHSQPENPFFAEDNIPVNSSIDSMEDIPPENKSLGFTDELIVQDVEDRKADRKLREHFADKAYRLAKKTLYGWAILLFCYGLCSLFGYVIFPDSVMIAITTAVTLNVFAAFLGVIRGLFPSPKSN